MNAEFVSSITNLLQLAFDMNDGSKPVPTCVLHGQPDNYQPGDYPPFVYFSGPIFNKVQQAWEIKVASSVDNGEGGRMASPTGFSFICVQE
jgi:hypothetical protein